MSLTRLGLRLHYKWVTCEPVCDGAHITVVILWARRGTDLWWWKAVRRWPFENREIEAVALAPVVGRIDAELHAYEVITDPPTEVLEAVEALAPWLRGASWRAQDRDR